MMAFRTLSRGLFQMSQRATNNNTRRLFSSTTNLNNGSRQRLFSQHQQRSVLQRGVVPARAASSVQTNNNAYQDLSTFLDKEIKLEKGAQKHPTKLPKIEGFEAETAGPEVTLTRQIGNEKVTVKFNVTHSVNTNDEQDNMNDVEPTSTGEHAGPGNPSQLKARPTFTVDINRGGQTLSFLCSYLPDEYPDMPGNRGGDDDRGVDQMETARGGGGGGEQGDEGGEKAMEEDFQIDEFAIHDGEWNDKVYAADCSVIDGELYDKLLNVLEERGIGEEFANQLVEFSTGHEHKQYIGLLEKLQQFVKK